MAWSISGTSNRIMRLHISCSGWTARRSSSVERHADETDVDFIEQLGVGEAEEGRDSAVARLQLRIGQFRIALNLLDHAEAP